MSLADELLADFEDAETEDVNDIIDGGPAKTQNDADGMDVMEVADSGSEVTSNSVRLVAKLRHSKEVSCMF